MKAENRTAGTAKRRGGSSASFAELLLQWYRANGIRYPWRLSADPYRIWLSEILLQQTRIPVALKYYEKILNAYPTLASLAQASEAQFLSFWSGAGYYARARNMLRCAREIQEKHNGRFPSEYSALCSLPGIGRYTAGALSNVCFDRLTAAIDGNVSRVLARLTDNRLLSKSNKYLRMLEEAYLSLGAGAPASEFFQSLMELGERVCLPHPLCSACPVANYCLAAKRQTATAIPVRRQKKKVEVHYWYMLALRKKDAFYYAVDPRRPFLRDAWLFPDVLTSCELAPDAIKKEFLNRWNIQVENLRPIATVRHTVTFRKIHVTVLAGLPVRIDGTGKWIKDSELTAQHTSSVTMKILTALAGVAPGD